ncbi:class II aldolase/adducin family protein [Helcococcus ovis]|uniref:class II aldolase/adducin family protein n=1 Tax=Helcococcus ovis TaxID=72026 RepID=UPI0038BA8214
MLNVIEYLMNKNLLDSTGGNISVKLNEDMFIITPSLASKNYFFRLKPEQLLLIDSKGEIIRGTGIVSREIKMHLSVYRANKEVTNIIHTHSDFSLVYATKSNFMPLLVDNVKKLKELKVLDYAKAGSEELAKIVENHFLNDVKSLPTAVLLKDHGLLVVGNTDLRSTMELTERIEKNAKVSIYGQYINI